MIAPLASVMVGDWEPFGAMVVLPDDPRPRLPTRQAISAEALDAAMPKVAKFYSEGDRRALVSLWSIHHAYVAMSGAIVASLALDHDLPLHIDETALVLDAHGLPAAIVAPHEGFTRSHEDAFARFDLLVEGHVAPVVEALAAYGKISRKVLWSNAANLYEHVYGELARRPDQAPHAAARGGALVESALRPDGARNRMHRPVDYVDVDDPIGRWRRVCCLRHLLPAFEYCANCPHRLTALQAALGVSGAPAA